MGTRQVTMGGTESGIAFIEHDAILHQPHPFYVWIKLSISLVLFFRSTRRVCTFQVKLNYNSLEELRYKENQKSPNVKGNRYHFQKFPNLFSK